MKRKTLYEGNILSLDILDDKWEVIRHHEAVAILVLKDKQILGVEQYRPAIGKTSWELPAGLIDQGETPLQAAKRELAEETQLTGHLELINQFYSSPGFTNEKLYLFQASNISYAYGELDEGEELVAGWHDPQALWDSIKTGETATSAPSILALTLALQQLS